MTVRSIVRPIVRPIVRGIVGVLGGFSPRSLFAAGEQGAWYDPSDFSTLFQNSSGTTPVTAVEQPVGLMLDKSKGLVLGPELVTNGNFSAGSTGWTPSGGNTITFTGGVCQITGSATSGPWQDITTAAGRTYLITFDVTVVSGFYSAIVFVGGAFTTQLASTAGTSVKRLVFTATSSSSRIYFPGFSSPVDVTFDNISVRELPGNHAFQSNDPSRPVLSAKVNLLTKTEQFDDAVWVKSNTTVSANSIVAPDGTLTADSLIETAVNDVHRVIQGVVGGFSGQAIASVYLKQRSSGDRRYASVIIQTGLAVDRYSVLVDLQTCSFVSSTTSNSPTNTSYTIINQGNGWCKISVSSASNTTGNTVLIVCPSDSATPSYTAAQPTYLGDITKGIYIWGADLRVANDGVGLPVYQRVNTATDYDTTGFPLYLKFETDDSFLTNSVDFATVTSDGQARRNLLTFPTAFDNAVWTKNSSTVTANTTTAPDSTSSADKLVSASATAQMSVEQGSIAVTSGVSYSWSVFAKVSEFTLVQLRFNNAVFSNAEYATFDLSNGTITQSSGAGHSITAAGNGWYRCVIVGAATATSNAVPAINLITNPTGGRNPSITGNGTDGIFIWGAQLDVGSTATAFQNIGTDKVTAWAGVRKLSDAATGVLFEISASSATNAGTFGIFAPSAPSATYGFRSQGSLLLPLTVTGTTFASPITNVLTGIGDISADQSILRVNAIQSAIDTSDQGDGNYGNYPIYIGRRNNATVPLNARLYSLIIRGAQSTATQIAQTETYVNSKTRAF